MVDPINRSIQSVSKEINQLDAKIKQKEEQVDKLVTVLQSCLGDNALIIISKKHSFAEPGALKVTNISKDMLKTEGADKLIDKITRAWNSGRLGILNEEEEGTFAINILNQDVKAQLQQQNIESLLLKGKGDEEDVSISITIREEEPENPLNQQLKEALQQYIEDKKQSEASSLAQAKEKEEAVQEHRKEIERTEQRSETEKQIEAAERRASKKRPDDLMQKEQESQSTESSAKKRKLIEEAGHKFDAKEEQKRLEQAQEKLDQTIEKKRKRRTS